MCWEVGVRGAQLAVTAHVMPAWSGAGLGRLSLRYATPVLEQKCQDFASKKSLKTNARRFVRL